MNKNMDGKKTFSVKVTLLLLSSAFFIAGLCFASYFIFSIQRKTVAAQADKECCRVTVYFRDELQKSIDIGNHMSKMLDLIMITGNTDYSENNEIDDITYTLGLLAHANKEHISTVVYTAKDKGFLGFSIGDDENPYFFDSFSIASKDASIDLKNLYTAAQSDGTYSNYGLNHSPVTGLYVFTAAFPLEKNNADLYLEFRVDKDKTDFYNLSNEHMHVYLIDKNTGTILVSNHDVPMDADYTVNSSPIGYAYKKYNDEKIASFNARHDGEQHQFSFTEYIDKNISIVFVATAPLNSFSSNLPFLLAAFLIFIAISILLSGISYAVLNIKLIKPLDSLVYQAEQVTIGNFDVRTDTFSNDEMGKLANAFNMMTKRIQTLVKDLEDTVKKRTQRLQTVFDSVAEGIVEIDAEGYIQFCNKACADILGYKDECELLGNNAVFLLADTAQHSTLVQGVQDVLYQGKYFYSEDISLYKSDKSVIAVSLHANPRYENKDITGAIVTFQDITQKKKDEQRIHYLINYDEMTGLPNRRHYEQEIKTIDNQDNLPISIIFADINSLKITNDIFGHKAGDELIKKASEVMRQNAGDNAFIARRGGDEFIMLLKNTDIAETKKIAQLIEKKVAKIKISALNASISLGYATKTTIDDNLDHVLSAAEDMMYRQKIMNRKRINSQIIKDLLEMLHKKSKREELHSDNVANLSGKIATALNLPEYSIATVELAGYMHDVGKIGLSDEILNKDEYNEEEQENFALHPVLGFRILNLFDDTLDIAEAVYAHHEWWDGSGFPKGLKEKEIPLYSRIIAVAEVYDALTNSKILSPFTKEQALQRIALLSGVRFDPYIVQVFLEIMSDS